MVIVCLLTHILRSVLLCATATEKELHLHFRTDSGGKGTIAVDNDEGANVDFRQTLWISKISNGHKLDK